MDHLNSDTQIDAKILSAEERILQSVEQQLTCIYNDSCRLPRRDDTIRPQSIL